MPLSRFKIRPESKYLGSNPDRTQNEYKFIQGVYIRFLIEKDGV